MHICGCEEGEDGLLTVAEHREMDGGDMRLQGSLAARSRWSLYEVAGGAKHERVDVAGTTTPHLPEIICNIRGGE